MQRAAVATLRQRELCLRRWAEQLDAGLAASPLPPMKKKVDNRIRTLIENGVAQRHRSFFVLVGDKGKDQVVNLHYILSKSQVRARPSVLWCYKKELELSSHKKKRMKQIKKQVQRGLLDPDKDDPFELFISATQVRASALPAAATALA